MNIGQVALRALQFLWTLLITALVGNAIHDATGGNPSAVNYAIFVAVFSWLVVLYGFVGAFVESIAIPIAMVVLDGLALLFTFVAGVVLAAELHVHSCNNESYTTSNKLTSGSNDHEKRCRELQASTAFFWFLFACYAGSFVLSGLGMRGSSGGMRKGGPSMSQV